MIGSWIKKLRRGTDEPEQESLLETLAPDQRFYVVGDIHGRLDLLQQLLTRLDPDIPLVFVGDYVDRGDYSAQVLHHLRHLSENGEREVICLLGNHEEMLLRFIEEPKRTSRLWLGNGGLQTLASFGLTGITEATMGEDAVQISHQLRSVIGDPVLTWLENRPLTWSSGNVSIVHAALDPALPIDDQPRHVCLWGHPNFLPTARLDGQWVVHGHTIVPDPKVSGRVISIDTGAFATGRLTAADISPGIVNFVSTGPGNEASDTAGRA
ncbi:metallophosphoesterase family protein [Ruegeria arenilitoris]|uniref:metallophosphoesterase family protein n=1 Tax=Ruegeria arenilitoris TaxID=1173585 RepID=UPI00147FA0EA|nr:metallophosphoesterase family protein [Ruegeria arenilitoris]